MTNKEAFEQYFNSIVKDMASENPKVPVSKFRVEAKESEASLFAPDWFQYMIFGRGPGKQPPPDRMLSFVQKNPEILAEAKSNFKYITEKGLAFLIGRKIGREGTDIYQGKRKGVGLLEAMEKNMPELLKQLATNEAVKIQTALVRAIK